MLFWSVRQDLGILKAGLIRGNEEHHYSIRIYHLYFSGREMEHFYEDNCNFGKGEAFDVLLDGRALEAEGILPYLSNYKLNFSGGGGKNCIRSF